MSDIGSHDSNDYAGLAHSVDEQEKGASINQVVTLLQQKRSCELRVVAQGPYMPETLPEGLDPETKRDLKVVIGTYILVVPWMPTLAKDQEKLKAEINISSEELSAKYKGEVLFACVDTSIGQWVIEHQPARV